MIRSWTDPDGITHHADEHSKAYRKRDERKPASKASPVVVKAEPEQAKGK